MRAQKMSRGKMMAHGIEPNKSKKERIERLERICEGILGSITALRTNIDIIREEIRAIEIKKELTDAKEIIANLSRHESQLMSHRTHIQRLTVEIMEKNEN